MKKSDNNETDDAKSNSVEPAIERDSSYYYDDATGYEVFTEDEDDEGESEPAKKNPA